MKGLRIIKWIWITVMISITGLRIITTISMSIMRMRSYLSVSNSAAYPVGFRQL